MAEKLCSFCHRECDMNKIQIKKDFAGREYICYNCYKRTGINDFVKITKMTAEEIRPYTDAAKKSDERRAEFKANKYAIGLIEADSKNQYWAVLKSRLANNAVVHLYSDIKSFSLVINNKTYKKDELDNIGENSELFSEEKNCSDKKSTFLRPNKCSKMEIQIECESIISPIETITLIDSPVKFDSKTYASAVNGAVHSITLLNEMMNAVTTDM